MEEFGASLIFISFGLYGRYYALPTGTFTPPVTGAALALLGVAMYVVAKWGNEDKAGGELE